MRQFIHWHVQTRLEDYASQAIQSGITQQQAIQIFVGKESNWQKNGHNQIWASLNS